jgi:hypothetical protein
MIKSFVSVVLLTLVLTGCGGGGGGSSTSTNSLSGLSKVVKTTTETNLVTTMASGDLNNDGLEDVVIGGWVNDGTHTAYISVFYQTANGTLVEKTLDVLPSRTYQGSQVIFIADFDNDGRNDIILPGFDDGAPQPTADTVIFWNNSGQFIRQDLNDQVQAHGACYSDVDRDGDLDMLVSGANGGLYVNNRDRTFTIHSTATPNDFWDTCSIVHNSNSTFSVLMGNSNQVAGFKSAILTFDYNYNVLSQSGIAAPVNNGYEFDLINSLFADINNDGHTDFVAVFNDYDSGVPGSKQVLLNDGAGNFTPQAAFDTTNNNSYYSKTFFAEGHTTILFGAINGDMKLYQIVNGTLTLYKQSVLDSLAAAFGLTQGNWNTGHGTVYQNNVNGKVYVLQYINGNYYTKDL